MVHDIHFLLCSVPEYSVIQWEAAQFFTEEPAPLPRGKGPIAGDVESAETCTMTIEVNRLGSAESKVYVDWYTVDGSAIANTHYIPEGKGTLGIFRDKIN